MNSASQLLVSAVLASLICCSWSQFTLPKLHYAYNSLEPFIDNETMFLHHTRHHNASVVTLNRAVSEGPQYQRKTLVQLLQSVPVAASPADNITAAIRNHGGSHFNHAMYWLTFCPQVPHPSPKCNLTSPYLKRAINKAWGSYANFVTEFTAATTRLFGSGWVWVVYKPETKKLAIVSTPNQDNPLMKNIVAADRQGFPILGIDLWEHAFYLKHRNVRANYVNLWLQVVDWGRVRKNLYYAERNLASKVWKY